MQIPIRFSLSPRRKKAFRSVLRPLRVRVQHKIRIALSRYARRQSRARFIGITGSSAKSTASSLLTHILTGQGRVESQLLSNRFRDISRSIRAGGKNVEYFVIEAGVDKIGDMDDMARVILPDIAVVTLVGLDHFKAFRNKEVVAAEKAKLVAAVQPGGLAILNHDDRMVMSMADQTQERIVTFGKSADADVRVVSAKASFPDRLIVELKRNGEHVRIPSRFVGEHFWVPLVAAFCAASELGVPTETIIRRCASFEPLSARCEVIETDDGPVFIVDTFKAPWESLPLALRIMETAQAPRKRIVLGGISDYAGSSRQKYKEAYQLARAVCDQVVFVGDHARRSRASDADRQAGRIVEIESVQQVDHYIRQSAIPGELILLKSSRRIHLERVAMSWQHDIKCWEQKCGLTDNCKLCGLYQHPFEMHHAARDSLDKKHRRSAI
jgi:UDP-N-acetylmuramoyl-tripeptide--D-alanyl-D-alanine ligase